jgi:uncharacterized protein YqhQ
MPAMSNKPNEFNYGGQAVIEGVMMRGARTMAVAVRNPAGEIVVHTEPLNQHIYGGRLARVPFLRGLTLLWDALGLGIKSLMFSAEVALVEEENGESSPESPHNAFQGPAEWATILLSLSLSIGLFFVLPVFVASQVERWTGITESRLFSNTVEGLVRLLLLVGYIWIIGFLPDIKRLYGYHGAEHKTINAYEAGAELTPASVAQFPLAHPRCGTAFLLTVVLLSILLYILLPPMNVWLRVITRLLFLPLIAGIAYEFLRFSAAHQTNPIIRFITKPNLALQSLTTREPDATMLEVAISAFEEMRAAEQTEPAGVLAVTDVPAGEVI